VISEPLLASVNTLADLLERRIFHRLDNVRTAKLDVCEDEHWLSLMHDQK